MFWRKPWEEADRQDLPPFMALYEQALPTIQEMAQLRDDMPSAEQIPSPSALIDGKIRLLPVLEGSRRIPAPRGRDFRRVKKDFEAVLNACVQAGDLAMELAEEPDRARFTTLVLQLKLATLLMRELPARMAALSEQRTKL